MNTDGSNYKMHGFHPFRTIINAFKYGRAEKHRKHREQHQDVSELQQWHRIRTADLRAFNAALGQENRLIIEGQKAHTAHESARVKDAISVRQEETKRGFKDRPKKTRFEHDPWQDEIHNQLDRNRNAHNEMFGAGGNVQTAPEPQQPQSRPSIWSKIKGIFSKKKNNGNNNNSGGNPPPTGN